jgi:peptidoglycan/xylan/chitin deacetylase (PgdA/CDA1 family)
VQDRGRNGRAASSNVATWRRMSVNPRPKKLALLRWLPQRLIASVGPAARGALYLTFDDGPHPEFTPQVLDALARHQAKASFFLIGDQAERFPDLVRRIAAEGHVIGNHSYSHPEFRRMDLVAQLDEIAAADRALTAVDGKALHPIRTPRGALPPRLALHLARRGRPIVFWSYDTFDYRREDAEPLLTMIRQTPPCPGDIVLMHDDGPVAAQLINALVPEWRAAGMSLLALPPEVGRT